MSYNPKLNPISTNPKLKRISTNLALYQTILPLLKTKKRIRQDCIGRNDHYMRLFVMKQGGNYDFIDVRIVPHSDAYKSLAKSYKEKPKLADVLAEDNEVLNYQRQTINERIADVQVQEWVKPPLQTIKNTFTATQLLESLTYLNANLAEYSEGETVVSDQLWFVVKSTGIRAHWFTRNERGYSCEQYIEYKPTTSVKRFLKEYNFNYGELDKLTVLLRASNCYNELKALFC